MRVSLRAAKLAASFFAPLLLFSPLCATQDPIAVPAGDIPLEASADFIPPIVYSGMTAEETAELRESSETFEFKSEVSRVMKIIIHSLYKKKDIFLRELISNSADALDKARFLTTATIDNASNKSEHLELEIRIKPDYEKNTLTISDTGIGMTKEELKNNLGTIAKSGTLQFMQNLEKMKGEAGEKAVDLIGQFGVGFYSAFLVADKVTVASKHPEDKQYVWEGDEAGFTITEDARNHIERGTEITLHLRQDALRFLKVQKLKKIINTYSEFLNFPIYLWIEEGREYEESGRDRNGPRHPKYDRPPRPRGFGDEEFGRPRHPNFDDDFPRPPRPGFDDDFPRPPRPGFDDDFPRPPRPGFDDDFPRPPRPSFDDDFPRRSEDGEHARPPRPHWDDEEFRMRHPEFSRNRPGFNEKETETKKDAEDATVENLPAESDGSSPPVVTGKWEHVNIHTPLWMKATEDITDKEYNDFYRQVTRDFQDPIGHIHFKAEGDVCFRAILYVQSKLNREFVKIADERKANFRLYVKRVFINDDQMDIVPHYLSFVKGVVDSDDFPIDVSRETLQQSRFLGTLKRKITSKALEMIKQMSQNASEYTDFLNQYSDNLKLGIMDDKRNAKKLLKLIRFKSSKSPSKGISLDKYLKRMKDGQKYIYYLAGDSLEEIQKSPFVEKLLRLNIEVLYMDEPMDEFLMQRLSDYEGHQFKNVAKEGLDLEDEEEDASSLEELKIEYESLTKWLESKPLSGVVSKVEVSNRLTTSPCAMVANKDGISGHMQRVWNNQVMNQNQQIMQKQILEINPRHPLIKEINQQVEVANAQNANHQRANDGESLPDNGMGGVEHNIWDTTQTLYDITALRSGYPLRNVVEYTDRIETLLRVALGVDLDEHVDLRDITPAPEKDDTESDETASDAKQLDGNDEDDLGGKKDDDDDDE
jgi:HSP90 family molecular chaperone